MTSPAGASGIGADAAPSRLGAHPLVLALLLTAACLPYYTWLLADGSFDLLAPRPYGLAFNSMLEHLLQGRFDIDAGIIGPEGFQHGGKTYAYFGVVPALLRIPLLPFVDLRTTDVSLLSCLAAVAVAATAKVAALLWIARRLSAGLPRSWLCWTVVPLLLLGGAQIQFLKVSIYQEAALWAGAFAAAFTACALVWCLRPEARRAGPLAAMAVLAALCLLTRISTGLGLYAACGLLLLQQAWRRGPGVVGAAGVLGLGIGGFLLVNYMRWGDPLMVADFTKHVGYVEDAPRLAMLQHYGTFHPIRIPFALSYYFLPVWPWRGSDGGLLLKPFQIEVMDVVELPPSSFLVSDTMLLILAAIGVAWLMRRRGTLPLDRVAAGGAALGLSVPVLLMLMAMSVTFRYRAEFYPLMEFLALLGLVPLAQIKPRPALLLAGALTGIAAAHLFLLLYKLSPWGDAFEMEQIGWLAYYLERWAGFRRGGL